MVPQLTGERRQEIAKEVGKYEEEAKIAIRNVRRDALDKLKKQEKASEITEDDLHRDEKAVQKVTDASAKRLEAIAAEKEAEIKEG